jgi:hypothetical protein
VCARQGRELVGFVNVAWDGVVHAFVLDTMVAFDACGFVPTNAGLIEL